MDGLGKVHSGSSAEKVDLKGVRQTQHRHSLQIKGTFIQKPTTAPKQTPAPTPQSHTPDRNKVAEFCYGKKGIIEFFDILFGQFTTKKAVSAKFNFYSGIKR